MPLKYPYPTGHGRKQQILRLLMVTVSPIVMLIIGMLMMQFVSFSQANASMSGSLHSASLASAMQSLSAFTKNSGNVVASPTPQPRPVNSPTNGSWYFAEGSVGGGFQEYLTLQNPDINRDATVNITYLFESQNPVVVSHQVPHSSRTTINVNNDLKVDRFSKQQAISAMIRVTSGPGIVAERPMYFNYKGISSGTDVIGATAPGTTFFFPVADTRRDGRSYYTYITILNPNTQNFARVTVTYLTGTCGLTGQPPCPTQTLNVDAFRRGTVSPLGIALSQQMAVRINSSMPVVVERPLYFSDSIANAGGLTTGASTLLGTTSENQRWLFAEGYTGRNFQEYLVLANYGTLPTAATIDLDYSNGHTQKVQVNVPPLGQYYFDVNKANTNPTGQCDTIPCQTTPEVSAEVNSNNPLVAERLMYFHYGKGFISGSTEAIGEAGNNVNASYAFAEGYTANTFQEFLTLQNPSGTDSMVTVTIFANNNVFQQQFMVKAHSRRTVNINNWIVPSIQAKPQLGADSYSDAMTVEANMGSAIVAERPMYFNYYGSQGGTVVFGYNGSNGNLPPTP